MPADLLQRRQAGSGRLTDGMVFLTVAINNTSWEGKPVRVEMTAQQAQELAADLIKAASGGRPGALW